MRVITDAAKTKHLKQKAAGSFVRCKSWKEEALKDILFKDKKTKQREWQKREMGERYCLPERAWAKDSQPINLSVWEMGHNYIICKSKSGGIYKITNNNLQ